jgi:hypothetical protein
MATRPKLKLHELRKILRSFGVGERKHRGKGGHTYFYKQLPGGEFGYPVPSEKDVKDVYVKGVRKRLRLTPEDGVTDDEFYSRR